jgi:phosphoribosylformylglycinamidine synthase
LTPEARGRSRSGGPTCLVFVDLADGKTRLGASCLAQVYNQLGNDVPDFEDDKIFKGFWKAINSLRDDILAYHDRSDGGLFVTVAEMCFAGRVGCKMDISSLSPGADSIEVLFNEELGCVIEVDQDDFSRIEGVFKGHGVPVYQIAHVVPRFSGSRTDQITIKSGESIIFDSTLSSLYKAWSETSYKIQRLRDNPECADSEFEFLISDYTSNPGLCEYLTFDMDIPLIVSQSGENRPRVAILREQGVNGHVEMAWAFHAAGFSVVDVHMSDLISGRVTLASSDFRGLVFPGGFSYGDVLGAGVGWAKTVLMNEAVCLDVRSFFERGDTFVFGGVLLDILMM